MKDPYATLGVDKNADAATIKRAHRNASKRHHPDTGGKPADMVEVNQAYMILRDPARRAKFDATGEDSQRDTATSDLIGLFINACEVCNGNQSPIEMVRQRLDNDRKECIKTQFELKCRSEAMLKRAKKVKRKNDGPNLLTLAMEAHAAGLEQKALVAKGMVEQVNKMLAILKDYDYELPKATMDDVWRDWKKDNGQTFVMKD